MLPDLIDTRARATECLQRMLITLKWLSFTAASVMPPDI